jgi:hypothetical protein
MIVTLILYDIRTMGLQASIRNLGANEEKHIIKILIGSPLSKAI